MGKKIRNSLRIYFSKLKKIRTTMSLPSPGRTTSSLLSACKHPKTSSFAVPSRRGGDGAHAATLSDVDRFLFENFQSLYIRDDDNDVEESSHPSPDAAANPSDVRTPTASSSAAAIDTDSAVAAAAERVLPGESVAVVTFSKDPYDDFRRSMQEMVEARGQALDWDFVGELLLCYLDLNDRAVHKHILRAFADIVVSFRRRPTTRRRRRRKKKAVMEE